MDWNFKSVAIVGSGAVGLYYGARLSQAGADVKFLARADYSFLQKHGLQVQSIHGDFALNPISVYQTPEAIGPVDLVIIAWKTTSNLHLPSILPPLLHSETQVMTLQNGLGNCEAIAAITGPERVLGGLCFVCINRLKPGIVHHSGGGRIAIGSWSALGLPGRAETLTQRFQNALIPAEIAPCLIQAQWEKLVWNIPFNGLSIAEGGVTTDVLLASPHLEQEIIAIMREVIQAGQALGLPLSYELIDYNINRTRPMGPYRTSSMIDYVEDREIEVAPIWMEPLRQAQAAGIDMPRTQHLLQRIQEQILNRSLPLLPYSQNEV